MSRSRPFRFDRGGRVARAIVSLLALSLPVGAAGSGAAVAASGKPGGQPSAARATDPGALPSQRVGKPGGEAETGKNRNNVIPPSLRSQYPLQPVATSGAPKTTATVTDSPVDSPVRGFDKSSSKELTGDRARFEQVYSNPDGTRTTAFSQVPVNYQKPNGSWAPIDPTLTRDVLRGGWVAPKNNIVARFSDRVVSEPQLASVALDADHEIAWGLHTAAPVPATVSGAEATYKGVARDTDLKLAARPDGVKESIILRSAAAPLSYTFPLRLKGLTPKLVGPQIELVDAAGKTRAVIPSGYMVDSAKSISAGVGYALVGEPGNQALRVDVDPAWVRSSERVFPIAVDPTVALASSLDAITVRQNDVLSGNGTLQVGCRPPQPDTQDCTAAGTQRNNIYLSFTRVTQALAHERILGAQLSLLNFDAGSCAPREVSIHQVLQTWSLTNASWPGPAIGPAVSKRAFNHMAVPNSPCPFKQEVFDLHDAGRQVIQDWVDGTSPNYGLAVRASSPNDKAAWKMFTGTDDQANPPRLYITHTPYDASYTYQSTPAPVQVTPSVSGKYTFKVTNKGAADWKPGEYYLGYRLFDGRTRQVLDAATPSAQLTSTVPRGGSVTLTGTVQPLAGELNGRPYIIEFSMVDATRNRSFADEGVAPGQVKVVVYNTPPTSKRWWPANGYQAPTLRPTLSVTASDLESPPSTLTYKFEVCEAVPGNDRLNCFFSGTGTSGSYTSTSSWTIPAGKLSWNKTYKWRVYVKDSGGVNEPLGVALTLLTQVPQPVLTSHLAAGPDTTGDQDFEPQVGNYTTAATDASVAVSGPGLAVARTYNSLDPRRGGAFGAGWSTRYDMLLKQEGSPGNALITYPDGQQVRFGLNPDGKYVAPGDRKATLAKDASGWTLRGTGSTTYRFDVNGRLVQLTEGTSKPLVLAYGANGLLTTVTSQGGGGRKLTFTWSGGHVTTVATDPIGGVALTWTYNYDGDNLTKACDPNGSCTSYESAKGSHYRSAVLDSRPESYWRLGDGQNEPATSEVDINLGDDNASYQGSVGYKATGALTGSTDSGVYLGSTGFASIDVKKSLFRRIADGAVEVWFRTNSGVTRPLLGYQNQAIGGTSTAGMPILYIGSDGKLRGQFWNGVAAPITTSAAVNNDQWHHAVLSAEGTKQTLYLDGAVAGTVDGGRVIQNDFFAVNQWGAAYAARPSDWPAYGTAARTNYGGSMDEAAVYSHPLSAQDVAQHYFLGHVAADQLTKVTEPSGKVRAEVRYDTALDRLKTYTDNDGGTWQLSAARTDGGADDLRRTVTVTDPAGRVWFYEYDALGGWLLRSGRPNGLGVRPEDLPLPTQDGDVNWGSLEGIVIRSYTHDVNGQMTKITDERGAERRLTYDDRGNVTSETACRGANVEGCYTIYTTYQAGLTDPLDPRWDLPLVTRDGRSSSATDNTYATSRTYTATGSLASVAGPLGLKRTYTYTAGTEAAPAGGTMPVGLLRTETDPRGAVTTYTYDSSGLLVEVAAPTGMRQSYTYDAIGRQTSSTTKVAGRADATTSYEYDKAGRVTAITGPRTTDAVSGQEHQQRGELVYDVDGETVQVTSKDIADTSADARVTTMDYDDHDRLSRQVDADGGETAFEYDDFGNTTSQVDALGNHYEYAYTARSMLAEVRLYDANNTGASGYSVIESRGYDEAGRQLREGDALGRNVIFDYYDDNSLQGSFLQDFHNPDGSARKFTLENNTYDGAGNLVSQVTDNGKTTTQNTIDALGRVTKSVLNPGTGPGVVSRTTNYTYDATTGDLTRISSTGTPSGVTVPAQTAVTDFAYDPASGQTTEQRVQTTAAPDPVVQQVTRWTYDQSGNVTALTQPRGNTTAASDDSYTTKFTYDLLGRQIKVEAPPVQAETNGGAPAVTRPTTMTGYDGFGAIAETKDPLGNVSKASYNKRGLPVMLTAPSYSAPAGGTFTPTMRSTYDALGRPTEVIDGRGNATRYTYDRQGHRTKIDAAGATNDDRSVWTYEYLLNGLASATTAPDGSKQQWTYDDLDRQITATQVERRPVLSNLTATTGWDDASNVVSLTSPSGSTNTATYDSAGQLLKSTDANGVVSSRGYDGLGRLVMASDGLGRATKYGYDLAGRELAETTLDKDGNSLGTASFSYDLDDNLITSTTASQHTATYSYDALGRPTRLVEPVSATASVTSSYGYDAAGNTTRSTDGRGNSTLYTTNTLGLPEKVIEPSTTAHPAATDRTWTASYDEAGNPVTLDAPGGVRQTRTFDAADRLIRSDGTGAHASTASRVLGYDNLGRLTKAAAPSGDNTYTYNDRGELLTAQGPSGAATFDYDADGQVTRRTDAAGTADFTYNKGRLASITDPITRATQSIGYNSAGQLASIDYGSGRVRSIGYDAYGRMASDTLKNSADKVVASIGYAYDVDSQITNKTSTGVQGAGSNAYTYDYLGRLSTWTVGGQSTQYGWDEASNRTSVTNSTGTKTATYDARDRLISDGTSTYSYTARGTLATKTTAGSSVVFDFDAFDRLITQGTKTLAYDSLDRPQTSGSNVFKYDGQDSDPVSDGQQSYGLGPNGGVLSVGQGDTKRIALTDRHGDVIGGFDPADQALTSLPDSRTYSPFGEVSATSGTKYGLGYQGDWTEPSTGQVNMGARWYDPTNGTFASRDDVTWPAGTQSAMANLYGYAAGNPVDNADADGHSPFDPDPNLGDCSYKWIPPAAGDDSHGTYKLICPPKKTPKPPKPPKGKGGDDNRGGGHDTGGDANGDPGGHDDGGGIHVRHDDPGYHDDPGGHKPSKPTCGKACQANKAKAAVQTYVTHHTIAIPGITEPHCSGGNAICPTYTGAPSIKPSDTRTFNDGKASANARQEVVNKNGPISTPSTIASGTCILCMGMGTFPKDICTAGDCFPPSGPEVAGDDTSSVPDTGPGIDWSEFGQAVGDSLLSALGVATEVVGGGVGLLSIPICLEDDLCAIGAGVAVAGAGIAIAKAGEDIRSSAADAAADHWSRVLKNESTSGNPQAPPATKARKPYTIDPKKATSIKQGGPFNTKFYKNPVDGRWWTKDTAGHAKAAYKVYEETDKGLQWYRDADQYGDFYDSKWKSDKGRFIPWKQLKGVR